MPRFKDEKHNNRAREIEDLISEDYIITRLILGKNGVFSFDRPVTSTIYSTGLYSFAGFGFDMYSKLKNGKDIFPVCTIIGVIGGLIIGGSLSFKVFDWGNDHLPWDEAKYLDKKIEELF